MWGPEFEIKVDIRIKSWISDWGSILRFNADPVQGNTGEIGQRIPGLWTKAKTNDTILLATNIGDNGNASFDSIMGNFLPQKWYTFVISQKKEIGVFISFLEADLFI